MLELVQKCAQGAPEVRNPILVRFSSSSLIQLLQVLDGDHVEQTGDRQKGREIMTEVAAKSIVLLKNEGSVLPLAAPKTMAIVGTGARSGIFGPNQCLDHSCNDGVLAVGWGSGYVLCHAEVEWESASRLSLGAVVGLRPSRTSWR